MTDFAHAGPSPNPTDTEAETLTAGAVEIDLRCHAVRVRNLPLDLTQKEYELLCHFVRHPRWVWSRRQLLELVWGYEFADPRVVTVHVGNLRNKLAEAERSRGIDPETAPDHGVSAIETVRGVGYRFVPGSARDEVAASPKRMPFVGREAEMRVLREALVESLRGAVRVVALAGEPGVGKTRLAEELAGYARSAGAAVHWGWCHEGPGDLPYEPWREIFGSWGCGDLFPATASLFTVRPARGRSLGRERERDRSRLLEQLTETLRSKAAEGAACLILEDIHWGDPSTLLAIRYATSRLRQTPLLLLLTYRPSEVGAASLLTDIVADVARGELGSILPLEPLSEEEVGSLIRLSSPGGTSEAHVAALAADVYLQTEGNPFFVTQLVRLQGVGPGAFRRKGEQVDLGREEGARRVVLHQLSRLSPSCRELLDAASVCGREFTGLIAAEAGGVDIYLLPALLSEAVTARVLLGLTRAPERFRFAHSLLREVVYAELPADRRSILHARLGAVLERLHAGELDRYAAGLAYHYAAAATAACAERAVALYFRAGRVAASQCAWEEACLHWVRGLELLDLAPPDSLGLTSSDLARVFEDMGDAYGLAGDVDGAIKAYENAAGRLPQGEAIHLARLKRKQVGCFRSRAQNDRALSLITTAESLLGAPCDSAGPEWWEEWIEVQVARGEMHDWAGEKQRAVRLLARIGPVLDAHGTERQRAEYELVRWQTKLRSKRFVACAGTMGAARRCAERFSALGTLNDLQDAHMVQGLTRLFSREEWVDAREHLVLYRELAKENHDLLAQLDALGALQMWHRFRGEAETVRRLCEDALSLAEGRHIVVSLAETRGNLAWAVGRAGDTEQARVLAGMALGNLEQRIPPSAFEWTVRWSLFGLDVDAGDLGQASQHIRAMLEPSQHRMPVDLEASMARFLESYPRGPLELATSLRELTAMAWSRGYL